MRHLTVLTGITATLMLTACGSGDQKEGGTAPKPSESKSTNKPADDTVSQAGAFPAAPDGYTRLTAATVPSVPPGGDVTYCQYAMAPLDHDVDIRDVSGYQSALGHHAVAFAYTPGADDVLGDSFPCMGTEFTSGVGDMSSGGGNLANMGTFLGGAAKGKSAIALPDGVSFRLKQGQGIMINVHYLNTTDTAQDGNSVVDVRLEDADPSHLIASMFVNVNAGFELSPNSQTKSSVSCVAGGELSLIMMSNHMHEFGVTATTDVTRADGTNEMLHQDPQWTYDMQFNPQFSLWQAAQPFLLHQGDTIRTSCEWNNTTAESIKFPREMCIGVGFALTNGDSTEVPSCIQGSWLASLP